MSLEILLIIFIIAIPTYFFCKWMMDRLSVGNKEKRRFLALIPTVVLSPLLYVGLILIWIFTVSYYPSNKFDKLQWDTNTEERYKMSEDIIESKMLLGKTKPEIVTLLGDEYYSYSENHIAYTLGFVPGLITIDPDVLDIYFENGVVTKVGQHRT